jgi:hypothetical protein
MIFKKYGYAWITVGFFLVSLLLHWFFGWRAFVDEAAQHGQAAQAAEYLNEMLRDTFENWQSEFLQLIWQVVGLAYFLYVGSPSSRESDDRMEAKLDAILHLQGAKGREMIEKLDRHFLRNEGHAKMMKHDELDEILAGKRKTLES